MEKEPRKSKTLHKPPLILIIYRLFFRHLGAVFPGLVGSVAYKIWFMVQPTPTPKREQGWINSASRQEVLELDVEGIEVTGETVKIPDFPVMTYYWENANDDNAPLVMLIHGWGGRGSQMGAFAEPLLKAGFSVLAFDNHAHGKTLGKASTIFLQSGVQQALKDKFGSIYAVVAHSFGGMVTPYSLSQGMQVQKVISISAPSRFYFLLERFSQTLHLPEKVQQYIIKRFKKEFSEDVAESVSSDTTSKQLGHIPALIIHDEDDQDVPISESELLHQSWPNSIMQRTNGLGHRRILYNAQVIENTIEFLK